MDDRISQNIKFRAREWLIALHAPDASETQRLACEQWRRQRPEHDTAFRECERTWLLLGSVPREFVATPVSHVRNSRPGVQRLAAAIAVCAIGLLYLLAPAGGLRTLLADIRTAPGEQRTVELDDGTQLQVNGATALSYRFAADKREIQLLAGEAFFTVAHDTSLPMIVQAGKARIRVTGTRFNVRLGSDATVLTLEEGGVLASREGADSEVRVRPHEQVIWHDDAPLQAVSADESEALAWQRGRMIFKSRPLATVVEDLSRHRRGRIYVSGDAGAQLVTGVFDTSDPDAVLDAIERTLDVTVVRLTPLLTIILQH